MFRICLIHYFFACALNHHLVMRFPLFPCINKFDCTFSFFYVVKFHTPILLRSSFTFLWLFLLFTFWPSSYLFSVYLEFVCCLMARSKTRKPWKSRKFRKFFSEIFKSEFWILAVGQNRKLGKKKTPNNFSEISEISDFSEFSICHFFIFFLIFFSLFTNVFSKSLFYICNYSPTLYFINAVQLSH